MAQTLNLAFTGFARLNGSLHPTGRSALGDPNPPTAMPLSLAPSVKPKERPLLELAGRFQQLVLIVLQPASPDLLLLNTRGLDALLRTTLQSVRLTLTCETSSLDVSAHVRSSAKEVICLASARSHQPYMHFIQRCYEGGNKLHCVLTCTFTYPMPASSDLPAELSDSVRDLTLVLVFPYEGRRGCYLQQPLSTLAGWSRYFQMLAVAKLIPELYGEICTTSWKKRREELEDLVLPYRRGAKRTALMSEDEDNEPCSLLFRALPTRHLERDSVVSSRTRYLVVRHTSYATYNAVFDWLIAGNIIFNPLRSASGTTSAVAMPKTGVSPVSVFRLASQLGLTTLASLALDNYRAQLSPDSAGIELFQESCSFYEELGSATMQAMGAI